MTPAHLPAPELPASRPLPVAHDKPTDILTATAPPRLMPPVTLPPPADDTRRPDTANGTLLVALQLPALVAKITFQVPLYPMLAGVLASAPDATAAAAKKAADKLQRRTRERLKPAKK